LWYKRTDDSPRVVVGGGLLMATQLWADSCTAEKAAVNRIRGWVVYDLQLQRPTLPTNEAKLDKAIELLGQCEHIDLRATLPGIRDFANSLCITPPLEQSSKQVELSGDAKLKLDAILKKLTDIGFGGAAKSIDQHSRGVIQSDLADSDDCKIAVFTALIPKLLEPHYHTEWSDEKTTFCTVYMHQPSDNSPCSNCYGHCTAPNDGTVTRFIKRDCEGTGCLGDHLKTGQS
jgi:hypothetical protein